MLLGKYIFKYYLASIVQIYISQYHNRNTDHKYIMCTPLTLRLTKCQDITSGCPHSLWICQDYTSGSFGNHVIFVRTTSGIAQNFLPNLYGLPSGLFTYIQGSSQKLFRFCMLKFFFFFASSHPFMDLFQSFLLLLVVLSVYSESLQFAKLPDSLDPTVVTVCQLQCVLAPVLPRNDMFRIVLPQNEVFESVLVPSGVQICKIY